MKKRLLVLSLCFFCAIGWSQATLVDSLETVWNNEAREDSLRLAALHELFRIQVKKKPAAAIPIAEELLDFAQSRQQAYWVGKALNNLGLAHQKNKDIKKGLDYFLQGLTHNEKENNLLGMAAICNNIARLYREDWGNYQVSIEYLQQSIEWSGKAGELRYQAGRYYRLGRVFQEIGEYSAALEAFFKGLAIYEKKETVRGIIRGHRLIAALYEDLEDYESALKHNQMTLSLSLDIDSQSNLAMAYNNTGNSYFRLEQYELAIPYYSKSLELKKKLKDEKGMANNYHNLGNSYMVQNQIEKAAAYYRLGMNLYKKFENKRGLSNAYCALGEIEIALGNFSEAVEWCEAGLNIARNDKHINLDRQMINSECLALAYKKLGDFEQAMEYQNIAHTLKDSLFSTAEARKMTQLEAKYKYENEKEKLLLEQQKATALYEAKLQKQLYLLIIFVSLALFLAIVAYLAYQNYLTKKSSHQQLQEKNKKILADKEVIAAQAQRLQKLDQLKTRFFTQVSHELRTPLTLMNTPIELIRHRHQTGLKTEVLEQLDLAAKHGKKLNQLIEELLDLQKLGDGQLLLHEKPTALRAFIEAIFQNFIPIAQAKNINYQFKTALSPEHFYSIDQQRVEKIINNLLTNALKFTPKNGCVQLVLKTSPQTIIIQVIDDGIGIAKEALPHIFDAYYQANDTTQNGATGFGIGLAYAKELSLLMGGTLTATSKLGKGSTFQFNLPRQVLKMEEIADQEIALLPPLSTTLLREKVKSPKVKKYSILIVEDHPDMQVLLHTLLSPYYQIMLCQHGQEAIEELQKMPSHRSIDFILSDLMMPVMDGYALLEAVKNHATWRQLPFLILTAKTKEQDKLKGLRMGVDDYLIKPFSPEELLVRIQNLLHNYEERQNVQLEAAPLIPELTSSASAPQLSDKNWLAKVDALIYQSIEQQENFKVADLAAQLLMGDRQLRRRLRELTGLSPKKYILEVKLHKARHLLENQKHLRVKEVMHQSGFNHKSYFSKVYVERFGVLPSSYYSG